MKAFALSAALVLALVANASALTWTSANNVSASDPNLIAMYHFDEGTGTTSASLSSVPVMNLASANVWKSGGSWGAGAGNGYIDNLASLTKDINGNVTAFTTYGTVANNATPYVPSQNALAWTNDRVTVDWSKSVTVSFWMKDSVPQGSRGAQNTVLELGYEGWQDLQMDFGYVGGTQVNGDTTPDQIGWAENFGNVRIAGKKASSLVLSQDQRQTLTNGQWHHVALVYNAETKKGMWYLDNVQQPTAYQSVSGRPPVVDGKYVWIPTSYEMDLSVGGLTAAVTNFWTLGNGQPEPAEYGGRGVGSPVAVDELLIYQGVITDFANGFGAAEVFHPGDANKDGVVTDADYTLWADNYNAANATWEQGDFNGDGAVTDADYTIWADHYGHTSESPVPEPATLSLLGFLGLGLMRRRK